MSSKHDQAAHNATSMADKPSNLPTSSEPAAPERTEAAGTAHQNQEARNAGKASPTKNSGTPAKSDDDEKQTDRPSARRERKQTAFFQPEAKAEAAKLDIKEGQGTKLGDIPNIAFRLSKVTGKDELLEDLHQICYGSKGKLSMRKKEIQAFSGFTAEESKLAEKAKGLLARFRNDHMHHMLDLLDIPRSDLKDKDSKIAKVIDFLKAPSQLSDKDLAAKDAQKKAAAAKKRQRKQKEGDDEKGADKPKRAKKADKGTKDSTEEDAKQQSGEEVDEEDEQPGSTASMPDDEELKKEVLAVLKGVDVQEFNIKMLMNSLNTKYKMDLKDKKPTIKAIAIAYCAQKASLKEPADEQ